MAVQAPTASFSDNYAGEPGVLELYCQYTSGATGAIPTTLARSQGFQSVARTGTGIVDFILNAPAFKLLDWSIHVAQATYDFTGAGGSDATLVDAVATATTPTSCKVTVTFRRPDTGVATDTAAGDIVRLTLKLKTISLGS